MRLAEEILKFWFGTKDLNSNICPRKVWFKPSSEFDKEIHTNFINSYNDAIAERLNHMKESQKGSLALILIFDQFSRNLFRKSPQAFATDIKAREITHHAITKQYDKNISKVAKLFFYLPLEHSENMADQELSLTLLNKISDKQISKSATQHYEIIQRFGRFPYRNAVLGRKNTPEEDVYLRNPPSWSYNI
jgi:uncharacterized protein (DUF924 family)